MKKIYLRWQEALIEKAMQSRRVLLLAGARQCGKTTLAKELATPTAVYRTLDDFTTREFAHNNPTDFVHNPGKMLIIDEVQRAPDLLSAIKMVVDEDTTPGQFLLTGSTNIQALPAAQESLAGRIRKIRLRPLTEGELQSRQPIFLDHAFEQSFDKTHDSHYTRKHLLTIAFRGGYPEAIKLKADERPQWHRDYIAALLERDLKDLMRITQHHAMHDLVHTVAAWSGKYMDISAIGTGLAIRRPTIESYLNALEALFLVDRIKPWTYTDYDRVGKQSKLYLTDSGLMASILRWSMEQVELDADRSGKLVETFIYNELAAQIDTANGKYELFHYRDREKREIDFLIERDDQALLGIEVKTGSTISTADFKHLKWFQENLAGTRKFIGIVLYSGHEAGSMGKNLWAMPYSELWANAL